MKKIYALIAFSLAGLLVTAQTPSPVGSKPMVNKRTAMPAIDSRGSGSYYLDYEGFDDFNNGGNYQTFIEFVHKNPANNGDYIFAVETFDSLYLTTDYQTWFPYDYGNHSVTIDSIYFRIHHQNNSGLDDTLTYSIVQLAGANYRPTGPVLWSNQIISSVDLTGHPSTPGSYPTAVFAEYCGFTVPAGARFGIKIEFAGDPLDTFAIVFGFPHDGVTLCGSSSTQYSPIVSAFYPSCYYQAKTGATASTLFPTASGGIYWYVDCNGNMTAELPQENHFQNWSVWTYVTIGPVGMPEVSNNGVKLFQNSPNPFNNETTIRYSLQKASNVSIEISDLTGRVISVIDEGHKGAGTFASTYNAGKLAAGTYFYTLKTENGNLTNRMVIKR